MPLDTRTFFCWIHSHIGIHGNEGADVLAKAALRKKKQFHYISYTDLSTTSLSTSLTFCKVNGTSMSPASCLRYNQPLSSILLQLNTEEMALSYAEPELAMLISHMAAFKRRTAASVLQYSSPCKTCLSEVCKICAHQNEIFFI